MDTGTPTGHHVTNHKITADGKIIKQSIKHNYDVIVRNLRQSTLQDLIVKLYANDLLTYEEKHQLNDKSKTLMTKCELLLDIICKKSDVQVKFVLETMQEVDYCICVYEIICKTIDDLLHGRILVDKVFIEEVKGQLIHAYKRKRYHCIPSIPGEKFEINLNKKEYIMPVDFKAKVKVKNKQADLLPCVDVTPSYNDVQFNQAEDIPKELLVNLTAGRNDCPRTVLFEGVAGTGKTVLMHKIVCQWVNQTNPSLNQFDLIIALPVRNVNPNAPIGEMISKDKRKGLGYFDGTMLEEVVCYLKNENCVKKVLILLDGIDEVDIEEGSELFNLITDDYMFPNVKVIITARPEAKILRTVKFYPDYKVVVEGTTREGVYKFLEVMSMQHDGTLKEEVHKIVYECEKNMIEFYLLQIPLYLTLVGIMFNDHWAKYASFSTFKIPDTTTKIFNAFLRITLRRWLEKLKHFTELNQLKFGRCIFYGKSTVSAEMKSKVERLGRMSYDFLMKKIYDFTLNHAEDYYINPDDITSSGLFCFSRGKYFYRHKLLQEFLAALYLVNPLCKEELVKIKRAGTFDDIFRGSELVLQFASGMSPNYVMEVMKQVQNNIQLEIWTSSSVIHDLQLNLPAKICIESCNSDLINRVVEILSKCTIEKKPGLPSKSLPLLKKFFSVLSLGQANLLLNSWYNVSVHALTDGYHIQEGINKDAAIPVVTVKQENQMEIESLDITLLLLLHKFKFIDIKSLNVLYSGKYVPDLPTLLNIFPNLVRFTHDGRSAPNNDYQILHTLNNKIDSIIPTLQHYSHSHMKYSKTSQELLFMQSKLQTLSINLSILHEVHCCQHQPNLPSLRSLQIHRIPTDNDSDLACICQVLKYLPHLSALSVVGGLPIEIIEQLFKVIVEHLPNLEKLHYSQLNERRSEAIEKLFNGVKEASTIRSFGLTHTTIMYHKDLVLEKMLELDPDVVFEVLYTQENKFLKDRLGNAETNLQKAEICRGCLLYKAQSEGFSGNIVCTNFKFDCEGH